MTREDLIKKNKTILSKYIPNTTTDIICQWIFEYDFKLIIKKNRKSKWGDFSPPSNNQNVATITINKNLNPYAFLITLVHEIAHCKTFREYGHNIEAHGKEWKHNFQLLMQEFLNTNVFPIDVLYVLRHHMKNPSASANADIHLYKVLLHYDENGITKNLLEYLNDGDKFLYENSLFQKIKKRRKKIECIHLETGRKYLFSPVAEIEIVV